MGPIKLDHEGARGVETLLFCRLQTQTGTGHRNLEELHDETAYGSFKFGMAPGQVRPYDAALPVGHGAERVVAGSSRDEVCQFDAISSGKNPGIRGLHSPVHHDRTPGGYFQTRFPGQLGVRRDAHRHNHQVRVQDPLVRQDPPDPFFSFQGPYLLGEVKRNAVLFHMVLGHARHVEADDAGQDLIPNLYHRRLDAPEIGQGFGHLKTDGACADYDGLFDVSP